MENPGLDEFDVLLEVVLSLVRVQMYKMYTASEDIQDVFINPDTAISYHQYHENLTHGPHIPLNTRILCLSFTPSRAVRDICRVRP